MNTVQQDGKLAGNIIRIRERWNRITDDDLKAIGGKREKLLAKLQERYGYPRDRAEMELSQFETDLMESYSGQVPAHSR